MIPWMIVTGYVAAWLATAVHFAERENEEYDHAFGRKGARRWRLGNAAVALAMGVLWPFVLQAWFIMEVADE